MTDMGRFADRQLALVRTSRSWADCGLSAFGVRNCDSRQSATAPVANIGPMIHTCRMFDPLFPLALLCGPLALAISLHLEANRTTGSIWPRLTSVVLALIATWGLTCWGLFLSVPLFGEGLKEGGLDCLIVLAISASVALVIGAYGLVVRRRSPDVPG